MWSSRRLQLAELSSLQSKQALEDLFASKTDWWIRIANVMLRLRLKLIAHLPMPLGRLGAEHNGEADESAQSVYSAATDR